MARFQVKYELTSSSGTKSGVVGTEVTASNLSEAKNKVKARHAYSKIRIISCVKVGN
jgi:hypothetical protein